MLVQMIHPGEKDQRLPIQYAQSAIDVLGVAIEETVRLKNPYHFHIETGHVLLGLVQEPIAEEILNNHGIRSDKVISSVEFIVGKGHRDWPPDIKPVYNPRVVAVVRRATEEALRNNGGLTTSIHILRALVHEDGGIAAGVLKHLNVDREKFYNDLQSIDPNTGLPLSQPTHST